MRESGTAARLHYTTHTIPAVVINPANPCSAVPVPIGEQTTFHE
jgi:hypothetical protein